MDTRTPQKKYSPVLTSRGADELFSQTTAGDWVKYIGISIFICSAIILGITCLGCSSKISGGTSLNDQHASQVKGGSQENFEVTIPTPAGLLTYRSGASTQPSTNSNSQFVSTTQPSAESTGNAATPQLRADQNGEWSAWFDQRKEPLKAQWPLALIFVAAAFACYQWGGNPLAAVACLGLAIIAIVMPSLLIWMAVAAIAVALWSMRKALVQLIRGNQELFKKSDPEVVKRMTNIMKGEHDETTQKVVKNLK